MKVAVIINTAWNIYNFRKGIVKNLLSDGHEVVAIAPKDKYAAILEEWGCTFRHLPISGSGVSPVKDLLLLARFLRLVKAERPDIMLTYTIKPNIYGSIIHRLLGIPIICNVSGLGTVFMNKGLVPAVAMSLYKLSLTHADLVFFQNNEDEALFTSRVPVKATARQLLNGSGIDLQVFQPRASGANGHMSLLMIGRLISEKGVYEYAEAARIVKEQHPEVEFKLLGGWDQDDKRAVKSDEMEQWQSDDLINYLGTTDDVRAEISKVHAVVLPSYREGTPRTLLEAGAMGLPLIATDVPGCRHVVQDAYNGFLCEAKSGKALAKTIIKFLALAPESKKEMGANSRKLVEEKFDERLIVNSYLEAIKKLVQRRN